jgi:cytidyltransferase-like protein
MGGAAGHMAHPFDLGWVNSGSDLLDFFEKAKTFVEKKGAGAVKIDGVNVSFKVVGDDENKQFAVDRGSLKPIDIEGITMDRVDDRFPEGHGMRPAIRTLLSILNAALPDIKSELEELGMWVDPSRFLNTEYVEGTTNVTEYDENFLAIHGLSQFYHKIHSRNGQERPGMERPEGVKAPSVEVPYNPKTMENLVKKLNIVAEEYGFQVYGSVPTEKMDEIDFSSTLSQPFTVKVSDDREITKSLKEWLSEATNPRYKVVKLKDGSRTHALHKQLYMNILNGETPIVNLIEDSDAEAAIYGAVLMHATRMLGNDVMRSLTSPMGDVMNHEGIVMRDEKLFGSNPVKITGDFIVGNLGGGFGQVTEEEGEGYRSGRALPDSDAPNNEAEAQAGPEESRQKIALIPGAFKPPHRGHLGMVEEYAQRADNVVVLISSPVKSSRKLPNGREITADDSKKIWETLVSHLPNVEVQISPHASPITATYDFIGKDGPLEPGTEVILGVSNKGRDVDRFSQAEKYAKEGVILTPPGYSAIDPISHSTYYMDILGHSPLKDEMPSMTTSGKDPRDFHASDMRYLLGQAESDEEAVELLEDFTGEDNIFDVLAILGLNTGLNELAGGNAMAAGAVAGAVGAQGGPWKRGNLDQENEEEKKRSRLKKENADLSMVDEIMRLFTERGIMR